MWFELQFYTASCGARPTKISGALGNANELRSQIQLRPLSHISLQKTRKKDWQHEWLGLHLIAGSFNQNS